MQKSFIVDFSLGSKYASVIGRNLLPRWLCLSYNWQTMNPLHVAVIVYFDVLHLVTERGSHRRWSIIFSKISQILQENSCAGVSTYQFNSQSMSRPDKRRSSHWMCSVKKDVQKNFTGKHLCLSLFLIKLHQIRSATLIKLDSNTDVVLRNLWNF